MEKESKTLTFPTEKGSGKFTVPMEEGFSVRHKVFNIIWFCSFIHSSVSCMNTWALPRTKAQLDDVTHRTGAPATVLLHLERAVG